MSPTSELLIILLIAVVLFLGLIVTRRKCRRCGRVFQWLFVWRQYRLCSQCRTDDGAAWDRLGVTIAFILALVGLAVAWAGWAGALRIGGMAALGVLFVGALLLLFRKDYRERAVGFIRLLAREREAADLAGARQAASTEGHRLVTHDTVLWTDTSPALTHEMEAALERTMAEYARLTGLPPRMRRLRLLYFRTNLAFETYTRAMLPASGKMAGYYMGIWRKRIALSHEAAAPLPGSPQAYLSHELTHHLYFGNVQRARPLWLNEGLAMLVAFHAAPNYGAPGSWLRFLRAADARGQLLKGDELLPFSFLALLHCARDWRNAETGNRIAVIYRESAAFVDWLATRQTAPFHDFMARLARTKRWRRSFRKSFDAEPERLFEQWLAELRAQLAPPWAPLDEGIRYRIDTELLPVIRDTRAPEDDRRMAIRRMGAGGYTHGAELLVDILSNPQDPLALEARYALENIAGEVRGETAEAWREWADARKQIGMPPRPPER